MAKVIFALLLINLFSCSSSSKKDEMSKVRKEIEKEYDWIENSKFISVPEIPYNERKDFYSLKEDINNSLYKESLDRLSEGKLENLEDSNDPLAVSMSHCYRRNFKDAFKSFDGIYAKYKNHPSFWNQLGSCYLIMGDKRKALLYYNKSRSIDYKYAPPVNNIGVIHMREGFKQKAFLAFKEAVKMNSASSVPKFNLAKIYLQYGFIKPAQKILSKLYRGAPTDPEVLNAMASSYLLEKKYGKAISIYSKFESSIVEDPYYGINFALALKLANRPQDARFVFKNLSSPDNRIKNYYREAKNFIGDL